MSNLTFSQDAISLMQSVSRLILKFWHRTGSNFSLINLLQLNLFYLCWNCWFQIAEFFVFLFYRSKLALNFVFNKDRHCLVSIFKDFMNILLLGSVKLNKVVGQAKICFKCLVLSPGTLGVTMMHKCQLLQKY